MTRPESLCLTKLLPSVQPPGIIFECAELGHGFYPKSTHLIGFGFDGTACFRKGAKDAPDAIREASDGIESYSPYLDEDLATVSFYDCGNLALGEINKVSSDVEVQWQYATNNLTEMLNQLDLKSNQIRLLTLGGEHSISYAPIKAYLKQFPNLLVLHLDAHADLRDGYQDYQYSHASIIYRVQEHFGQNHRLLQYGIRSGTKEEYCWMKERGTLCQSLDEFLEQIDQLDHQTPIYLTLDLDYFDPGIFAGTGTPEPGGEDFHSFIKLVKRLNNKNLVGCDVVELAPNIDSTGNSDVFAAKVVRELILCMEKTNAGESL